jgi:hypothetical protein
LVRQMLVESLLLAGIAGAASLAVAWATTRLLMGLKPANIPVTVEIPLDWRVVLFTLMVTLAAGVVFGLAPALRASAVEAARALREESQTASRKKTRARNFLVIVQMAACVVLLTGAVLCVRSLKNASTMDPGFDTHHIALTTLDPGSLGYTPQKVNDFYARLLERVQHMPGVTSASYAAFLPLGTAQDWSTVGKQLGKDPNPIAVGVYHVEPGFFRTMGIPLLRGRDLAEKETDSEKPDAVVINEYLARKMWPGEDPVGKRFAMGGEKSMSEVGGSGEEWEIPHAGRSAGSCGLSRDITAGSNLISADIERLARADQDDGARGGGGRSTDGGYPGADDRRVHGATAASGAGYGVAAGCVRISCGGDDVNWVIRSHFVCCVTEDARDRRAHGAGCAAERCAEAGDWPRIAADSHWPRNWIHLGVGGRAAARAVTVRNPCERSGHNDSGSYRIGGHRAAGVLLTGAQSDASRSFHGAQV